AARRRERRDGRIARWQGGRPRGADTGFLIPPLKGEGGDEQSEAPGGVDLSGVSPPDRAKRAATLPLRGGIRKEAEMDANELRAMQAPIKERYKGDPGAALITL